MRTVTIKTNGIGRYDDVSPFLVESGTLELKINLPNVQGEFFLVTELNGKNDGAKAIPRDGTVMLTGLAAGELHAAVKHYLRGDLIETYKVEPLLLKAVDTALSAMPEIASITAECAVLLKKTEELTKRLTYAEERADEAENRIRLVFEAFLAFAYSDYQTNVQLNAKSLTLEQFMLTLGFSAETFSEKELEIIKTFKEKL